MIDALTTLAAALASIAIIGGALAWVAILPTIGLLWVLGWLS